MILRVVAVTAGDLLLVTTLLGTFRVTLLLPFAVPLFAITGAR